MIPPTTKQEEELFDSVVFMMERATGKSKLKCLRALDREAMLVSLYQIKEAPLNKIKSMVGKALDYHQFIIRKILREKRSVGLK